MSINKKYIHGALTKLLTFFDLISVSIHISYLFKLWYLFEIIDSK